MYNYMVVLVVRDKVFSKNDLSFSNVVQNCELNFQSMPKILNERKEIKKKKNSARKRRRRRVVVCNGIKSVPYNNHYTTTDTQTQADKNIHKKKKKNFNNQLATQESSLQH